MIAVQCMTLLGIVIIIGELIPKLAYHAYGMYFLAMFIDVIAHMVKRTIK